MPGTVLIIPGWQNSGPQHWQSLWQRKLANVQRVEQRDWQTPQLADWIAELSRSIAAAEAPITLVAHSLGSITVAHWAAAASPAELAKVQAAMLVAAVDVDRPGCLPELCNFAPLPLAPLPFRSLFVASENDPYCEIARSEFFAHAWGSQFVNAGPAGHINTEAGFGAWPEGERLLQQLTAIKIK